MFSTINTFAGVFSTSSVASSNAPKTFSSSNITNNSFTITFNQPTYGIKKQYNPVNNLLTSTISNTSTTITFTQT
jgi:hypothetical protein